MSGLNRQLQLTRHPFFPSPSAPHLVCPAPASLIFLHPSIPLPLTVSSPSSLPRSNQTNAEGLFRFTLQEPSACPFFRLQYHSLNNSSTSSNSSPAVGGNTDASASLSQLQSPIPSARGYEATPGSATAMLPVTVARAPFPFCLVSRHHFRQLALPRLRPHRGGDYCRPCAIVTPASSDADTTEVRRGGCVCVCACVCG